MYISGQAGTGKSTILHEFLQHLLKEEIATVCTAYTHKAKTIIMSKVPPAADVQTLHAFLKKRPGINENATKRDYITMSQQFGEPEPVKLLIVDEYSMVDEADLKSIMELNIKVIFLGDPNQLDPISGPQAVIPQGKFDVKLTHIYRQEGNVGLLDPLCTLVHMIETKGPMVYLEPTSQFIRNTDIVKEYIASESKDKVILAFTNNRVEYLNYKINKALQSDYYWCPTTREMVLPGHAMPAPPEITTISGESLKLKTKWKTLEQLIGLASTFNLKFGAFTNSEGETTTRCYVFGHGKYNEMMKELKQRATDANLAISNITDDKPAVWAKKNWRHQFAKLRAKAWRELLTIDGNVVCMDYPYATTVHKSQGSTYDEVFVDSDDIGKVSNVMQFKKLMYVGISRASSKVYLNT